MKTFAALLLSVAISATSAGPTVYDARLDIEYHGTVSSTVEHFQNLRFAHDTSGQRRFAPPEPYVPARGSKVDATSPGPACPQTQNAVPPFFSAVERISEDCLNLRIARPQGVAFGDNVPVVVWVHGGGIIRGSAYDEHFDPTRLLELSHSSQQPIIFAAIQFRIGIFGFASLDTLRDQKSLNLGLRDQRAAFHWLKRNIAAFGGDPDRITALGHSAGATLLSLQTMAYGGSDEEELPFGQAWLMSGPPGTSLNTTTDATTFHTRSVARILDCDTQSDQKVLSCLRSKPMMELFEASTSYAVANHPPMGMFTFIPSTDGDFLPDRPSQLLRKGRFTKDVPLVLGWTHDDGAMNTGPAPLINTEQDMRERIRQFASELSDGQMSRLLALYRAEDFEQDVENYMARKSPDTPPLSPLYFALSRLLRDLLFSCPAIDFSYHMLKRSRLDTSYKSRFDGVRLYDLNQSTLNPIWNGAGMEWIGASHGSDIPYIFDGVFPEAELDSKDRALAEQLASNLIAFAHNGNPAPAASKSSASDAWPVAFKSFSGRDGPSDISIHVVGGPLGTNTASATRQDTKDSRSNYSAEASGGFDFGTLQQAAMNTLNFGRMASASSNTLDAKLQEEKLFERCSYINSISESLGN